jgi:uncharacterized protein
VSIEPTVVVSITCVLALAFAVETALGFGAALITVAIGSFVIDDLREILAMTVPLNLLLSLYLVGRYRRHVDGRFLFTRLLPLMVLGMPIGIYAFTAVDASLLKRSFGAFIVVVAALELHRMRVAAPPRPVSTPVEVGLLLLGGAVHGAFSTGGPMAVYVTSRVLHDKNVYRATLSSLWLVLGSVLLATYAFDGRITTTTLTSTALVSPGIVVGMAAGEMLFRRVPVDVFRRIVFVTLLLSGLALVIRG